jgi:hypothetical protein
LYLMMPPRDEAAIDTAFGTASDTGTTGG